MRSSRSIAVLSGLSIAFACGPSFGGSLQYPFVRLGTRQSCSSGSEPQKPMMTCSSFDLLTVTGAHLQQLFQDGETSSLQVVEACMDQIGTHSKVGLNLRAILSLAPSENVFEKATVLDEERKIGKVRSQLHGIPIILKDCIATDPIIKMNTTAGCWALATSRPSKSAPVVDRIVEAGLIPIGKASLTEFNNWKGSGLHDGRSPVGGQTQSAYVDGGVVEKDRAMGHSVRHLGLRSAWQQVLVLSLGQETDGSLIAPTSRAALFALKPTIGSVTMDNAIPVSSTFDTIGGMARSVLDLATLTEIILDPPARAKIPEDGYLSYLTANWEGLRLGFLDPEIWKLPESLCEPNESALTQMRNEYFAAIEKIRGLGAHAEYLVELPQPPWPKMGEVMTHEFKIGLNKYLSNLESTEVRTLAELVEWNKAHADIELPPNHSDQANLLNSLNDSTSPEDNAKTVDFIRRTIRNEGVNAMLEKHNLDAIAILTDSPISSIAAASGYPVCTMPLGYLGLNGRPFGMAMIAEAHAEGKLLRIMSAWEDTFPRRKASTLLSGKRPDSQL